MLGDEYVVLVKADGTEDLSLLHCLVSSPVVLKERTELCDTKQHCLKGLFNVFVSVFFSLS